MLQEGDVIELKDGMKVYADIPEHFVFLNKRGSFKLTHSEVTLGRNFDYLCGKYVVVKTALDGGGTGHDQGDIYPNGHHVVCRKLDDQKIRVDFYQSGAFTAIIEDIEPTGKATLTWTFKE